MKLFTLNKRAPRPTWEFPASSWTSGATFLSFNALNHCYRFISFNAIHLKKDTEANGYFCLGTPKEKQLQRNVLKGHRPGFCCKLSSSKVRNHLVCHGPCEHVHGNKLAERRGLEISSDDFFYVEYGAWAVRLTFLLGTPGLTLCRDNLNYSC